MRPFTREFLNCAAHDHSTAPQEKGLESICEALTAELPDYVHHWACSRPPARLGYAGVATLSKVKPLNVTYGIGLEEGDMEGRTITTEFEHCFVVNTYGDWELAAWNHGQQLRVVIGDQNSSSYS